MFSGIVQQLGTIKKITTKDSLKTFCIKFDNSLQCSIGDSVAINGTCLTVTKLDKQNLTANFDAVPETLKKLILILLRRTN